jgi:hypothetical protein
MGLRFWNFVLERENGSTTCDNMGIYGINVISLTLVAKARPLSTKSEKTEEKDKPKLKKSTAISFSSNEANAESDAKADATKAPEGKAASGAVGKSPRAKFIQSVPMHDGIGRIYTNNIKAALVPKPPKLKAGQPK